MRLHELQRRFWTLCTRPGEIAADADLAGLVDDGATLPARARLDIYAEMYFCRIHDVLAEQHARLRAVLGVEAFRQLVLAYLANNRPRTADIGDAGDRLPGFLAARTPALPWLAELAALERRHVTVFAARDAAALTSEILVHLEPAALERLWLRLVTAHALLEVGHAVEDLWLAPAEPPRAEPGVLIIWRRDVEAIVRHRRADDLERAILPRVAAGCSLGELAGILAETRPIAEVAGLLFERLRCWVDEGLLAAPDDIQVSPEPAVSHGEALNRDSTAARR